MSRWTSKDASQRKGAGGPGPRLDQAAVDAIKNRCRFKPAIAKNGEPVAFVIQSYTFRFELPR